MNVYELVKEQKNYMINTRRYLHQYPELSWQEHKTSDFICKELSSMNIEYKRVCETGVIATIKGKGNNRTVALRADIDALPVTEANECDYKSKNTGVMHACGHDSHIAMLLGAAKVLKQNESELENDVRLIFQPAEELMHGAKEMIKCDALKDVDNILGIHIWSNLPYGKISAEEGPRMASADTIYITIKGKSGHGSMPHQTIDSVVVASSLIMNLQTISSRGVNPVEPVVISIGTINGGTAPNIIANTVKLSGTVRCFSNELRDKMPEMIENIVKGVCNIYGSDYEFVYDYCTGPVINDKKCSQKALDAVSKTLGSDAIMNMEKTTAAEDFSQYLQIVPGCLAFVGCRNEETGKCYPQHNDRFDIEEDAMVNGAALYVQYAMEK